MIYFAQTESGSIKIGTTTDLPGRLAGLESDYKGRLCLLATMPGGRAEERAIHARFAHLRLGRTEQFRPGPDLMAFIGKPLLASPDPDLIGAVRGPSVVVVWLSDDELAELARLRDRLEAESGARKIGLAGTLRSLLRRYGRQKSDEWT